MLLERIEKYLKSRRMPPTRFGRAAVGDPCFVFDLRDGREPRNATVQRVQAYLDRQELEQPS
jgi:2,4-dienoyl-CoA reductase-like NADH-dependent reductase (Old Yellow Enzyme family)